MRIEASAPGKLVVIGEYAVLEGAPALVLAVDRRAGVVLEECDGDECRIDAPEIGVLGARWRMDADGCVRWSDLGGADAERMRLITTAIETLCAGRAPAPFRARLDTRAFFLDDTRQKLGLGSSAALTVALTAAVAAYQGRETPSAQRLIAMHRMFQDGRGSGVDVAASLRGGATTYRLHSSAPRIAPVVWPSSLQWCCVWSGRPAQTAEMLQRMAVWRARAPASYGLLLRDLRLCAEAASMALDAGNVAALLETVALYAEGLRKLGEASGVDIVSFEHRAIGACAAACGVTYKPCGAGGGDVGIALAADPARLRAFRKRIAREGFREIEMELDPQGLRVLSAGSPEGIGSADDFHAQAALAGAGQARLLPRAGTVH
ncbi:MAG: GHMP family kinase ATP-binding protein [Rhodanobacteraceae bacterium]